MSTRGRRSAALAGALLIAAASAAAAATSRSGAIARFDGVDEIVEACTSATGYVDMPRMSRTFSIPKGSSASVVVTLSAAASLSGGEDFDTGFVRLLVDNQQQTPGEVPFVGLGERGAQAFTWQTKALSPGQHTARVQYRTDLGSGFCVDARSLVVLHR